ncbi:hypothetical protein FRC01_007539 [Tulasnella sp. 417]|nr:hypothetical protein FRC01_007539 [Tulasnella sp. 417]
MHILDLPFEILMLVFEWLDSWDLLRCAVVCGRWKDLALDAKWRGNLIDWVNLLQLLGPVERCKEDEYRWVTKPSINDAIMSTGWQRLDVLRKKITRLRVGIQLVSEDLEYIKTLQHATDSPYDAFFPNLRQLNVWFRGRSAYQYGFLAGESLQQFNLNWLFRGLGQTTTDWAGALESVALRSPMVKHIKAFESDSPFIDYGKFSRLRTLDHGGDLGVLSWIQICAGCPLLEEVKISQSQVRPFDETGIVSGPDTQELPALRNLDIRHGLITSYILRTTNMPQLRELDVGMYEFDALEVHYLLSRVRRRSPLLETLTLGGNSLEWDRFSSFSGLRDLTLFGQLNSCTTEDVEHIIEGLPNLARLGIASNVFCDRRKPPFTTAILETLAMRCQLDKLRIPLNALETSWESETPTPTAKFDRLIKLRLDHLHIKVNALVPFAKYLAQMCPTVDRFKPTLIHPHEAEPELEPSSMLTQEEWENGRVMEDVFLDAQMKYRSSGGSDRS